MLGRDLGLLRIAAAVPALRVADVDHNADAIIRLIRQAREESVQVLCFPEMALTGYTIGDLVQHPALLSRAASALGGILSESAGHHMLIVVGMPVIAGDKVYNAAVALSAGRVLGVVPKTYLPGYKEFYEYRWFASGGAAGPDSIEIAGGRAPFGVDILFRLGGAVNALAGIEICEDLWVPLAPHEYQSLAGASVLINISASNQFLDKPEWRRTIVSSESGRCLAAYCYVSAGAGESSNDVVFSGHAMVAENGVVLRESERYAAKSQLLVSDVDLERLAFDRRAATTFQGKAAAGSYRTVAVDIGEAPATGLRRALDARPFVPADPARRAERCREIFAMQVAALGQKLSGARKDRLVIGVSGGLDSTLALLVAVKTTDALGLPRGHVHAYTLPGFGTTGRTRNNAVSLCRSLGVTFAEVDIKETCAAHLRDLGHKGNGDIVFENVQARYRTEFLFNKANEYDGIVLGTGDLTEIALGWATYGGDHISHYHVNASVPKTLVRYLVRWVADDEMTGSPAQPVLYDILETPISPELLRPSSGGLSQKSEEIIGPVELADFFLYPFIRFGTRPGKILFLANEACRQGLFEGQYTLAELHRWLRSFITRFFANQFKRTCLPEGPKVGSVSLSPRGDWRMPSDAAPAVWLADLEAMYARLKAGQEKRE
ncbi:MAG: NAD(+) synthase [Chloroflexi bacterium]|nr:NAD(+) synthase [Chloroflexota bacterium]